MLNEFLACYARLVTSVRLGLKRKREKSSVAAALVSFVACIAT